MKLLALAKSSQNPIKSPTTSFCLPFSSWMKCLFLYHIHFSRLNCNYSVIWSLLPRFSSHWSSLFELIHIIIILSYKSNTFEHCLTLLGKLNMDISTKLLAHKRSLIIALCSLDSYILTYSSMQNTFIWVQITLLWLRHGP